MQSLLKSRVFLGIVLLFILGAVGYRLLVPNDISNNESALSIGKDLIELSDQLARAQLSQALFSTPGYRYLTDFTAPIPQQPLGRSNPFEIIGRD